MTPARLPVRCVGNARGFTLVEVLVALTLTSLLLVSLTIGLRGISEAAIRADKVSQRTDEMRLVSQFLRRHLSVALWLTYGNAPSDGAQGLRDGQGRPYFAGGSDELRWVGELQAVHVQSPLVLFLIRHDRDRGELHLHYLPYPGKDWREEWTDAGRQTLLHDLDQWQLSYQDDDERWHDSWSEQAGLPVRIAVRIQAQGRHWPELIIPVRQR